MADQVLGNFPKETLNRRYEVQRQLGKKAGRQTLLACDLETLELVVVKLLSFGNDFEWDNLKLFEREAETLKALSHSAIPRYLNYSEIDSINGKGFALVQTYIEAKSLEEHLEAGRSFSEQEVKQVAKALLEILIYLHGRQPSVIHRDIKPSNILLTNRSGNSVGEVYLVDFGSVQTLAARESGTYTVVGTYGYMPPEQFGGRTVPASDLYSLGATLIALVTGAHPADLAQKDGRMQFEQVANLSPVFACWLREMTQPSLDQRLTSAHQALVALEQPQHKDTAPLVVGKPTGSKIELTKNADSLEILIPPEGFNPRVATTVFTALVLYRIVFNWLNTAHPGASDTINDIFSLLFWLGEIVLIWCIVFALFGRIRLQLNQEQITLTYELFGCKFNSPRPASRQDISKLKLIKKSYFDEDNEPHIIISAGTQEYRFGSLFLTTSLELEWLAHELSDWLGLPIIRG